MVQYNANPSVMSGSGSGSGLGFLVRRQRSAVSPFRGFLIFGWNMTFLNASVGDVVIMQEGENRPTQLVLLHPFASNDLSPITSKT